MQLAVSVPTKPVVRRLPVGLQQRAGEERLRCLDGDHAVGRRRPPVAGREVALLADRDRAAVLGRGRDHLREQPGAGEGPGGVVDHHHVDLTGVDRRGERLQRLPLGGVPAVAADDQVDRGRSDLAGHGRGDAVPVLLADDQQGAFDVRQQPRPPDRPREHAAPGERQQHLVGVVSGTAALARGEHDQRRPRRRAGRRGTGHRPRAYRSRPFSPPGVGPELGERAAPACRRRVPSWIRRIRTITEDSSSSTSS